MKTSWWWRMRRNNEPLKWWPRETFGGSIISLPCDPSELNMGSIIWEGLGVLKNECPLSLAKASQPSHSSPWKCQDGASWCLGFSPRATISWRRGFLVNESPRGVAPHCPREKHMFRRPGVGPWDILTWWRCPGSHKLLAQLCNNQPHSLKEGKRGRSPINPGPVSRMEGPHPNFSLL